jgi:tRNA modification GTPase
MKDIIVAQATPPGHGGVGIVRLSGESIKDIAIAILGRLPQPRHASYCAFRNSDGSIIDQGLALYFPAPHSFTGEDILELHGHGGVIVLDCLLRRILSLGARMARPGEFSERAFLNNKIDLTQAEAIADLIAASSEQAARSAIRSLQGEFSKQIKELVESITHLRMYVEATIDFPEEEIDFLSDGKITASLKEILCRLDIVSNSARQGSLLNEGMKIVIAGKPNAGKSSLLNCLSGQDTAIVSVIPGTTRDILRENILIDGMPLQIADTAGLRESHHSIEKEGIRRAWLEIDNADRILLVVDATEVTEQNLLQFELLQQFPLQQGNLTVIRNKIDLTTESPQITDRSGIRVLNTSARTGEGIDLLKKHLKECMGYAATTENCFIARRRHLDALMTAKKYLLLGQEQLLLHKAGELLAEELREAQNALSEITGEFRSDDLLGKIFSSFCIGK